MGTAIWACFLYHQAMCSTTFTCLHCTDTNLAQPVSNLAAQCTALHLGFKVKQLAVPESNCVQRVSDLQAPLIYWSTQTQLQMCPQSGKIAIHVLSRMLQMSSLGPSPQRSECHTHSTAGCLTIPFAAAFRRLGCLCLVGIQPLHLHCIVPSRLLLLTPLDSYC